MRTKDINEALQTLQQIEKESRDFIAPANKLAMIMELTDSPEEVKYLHLQPVQPELYINEYEQMPLNPWAHNQLAEKLGIPQKYYDRMLKEEPFLLRENTNTWLRKNATGKYLVRTTAGQVRAILSDRYRPIPNEAVTWGVLATLNEIKLKQGTGFTVRECALSETTMYLKVTADTVHLMKPEYVNSEKPELNGDPMFPGIMIRNSEVGASRFQVDIYTWRQWCSNGAILTTGLSKIHLGRKIGGEGEIRFSEMTEELDTATVLSGMKDIVQQAFEPAKMQELIERIKAGQQVKVDEPVVAVENLCKAWKLPDTYKDEILARFGDKTVYGLGNAVTEFARDQESIENQIKLEEIGGEILVLDEEAFRNAVVRKET